MCCCVAGTEFNCLPKLAVGPLPLPIRNVDSAETGMRLPEVVVKFDRLRGRLTRPVHQAALPRPGCEHLVGVTEAGVSQGISGLFLDSLIEVIQALSKQL